MARTCSDCCCDISTRHHLARVCLKCARRRGSAPDLTAARRAVAGAIRKGLLVHPRLLDCADCGKQARDYDHRDYSKPLVVEPVCRSCNKLRGPGIRAFVGSASEQRSSTKTEA